MGASAYVGRVGGLAVALGVGAAVATGQGVAWATETGSDSSTSEHSVSEGLPTAGSPATTNTGGTTAAVTDPGAGSGGSSNDTGDANETEEQGDSGEIADGFADGSGDETGDDTGDGTGDEAGDESNPSGDASTDAADNTGEGSDQSNDPGEAETTTDTDEAGGGRNGSTQTSENLSSAANLDATAESTVETDDSATTDDSAGDSFRLSTLSTEQPDDQAQTFATSFAQDFAPVTLAAPQADGPSLQRMVVNVLASLSAGLNSLASTLPGAPIWSPFVMAVLAMGARRELTEPVTALARTAASVPVAALAMTDLAAAAVFPGTTRKPVKVSANTAWIEYVTGAGNLNNTTSRFGIGGTDLGIMWDNGTPDNPATTTVDEHQVLVAFGDTFSVAPRSGVWRFNTLFRTPDDNLSNGLYVPNGAPVSAQVLPPNLAHFSGSPMEKANWSDPILPSPGDPVHPPYAVGPEVTIIPTAGVSTPYNNAYGARQYMSFMSIRSWDTPGRWTTNYSGVAYSDDNGQTWTIAPTSIRSAAAGRATVPYVAGNQNFQQGAFVTPPKGSAEETQGWVYSYGTPSGRAGTLYLSRVQETQILDSSKYQYWNGSGWVANSPSAATPILPATTTSSFFGLFKSTKYPSVSEMSVQYNPYLKKYVMLYGDSSNRIVMRTANSPQGTWSNPKVLVGAWSLGGKYAPYIHPWSGTNNLSDSAQYLYWNLSTWGNYQVRLMRTDLTKV